MPDHVQTSLLGGDQPLDLLGARQRLVLQALRERGGLTANEAGALVHAARQAEGKRGHVEDERCEWCQADGENVLRSLRAHGLAAYQRGLGRWEFRGAQGHRATPRGDDGPATYNEFPEGF